MNRSIPADARGAVAGLLPGTWVGGDVDGLTLTRGEGGTLIVQSGVAVAPAPRQTQRSKYVVPRIRDHNQNVASQRTVIGLLREQAGISLYQGDVRLIITVRREGRGDLSNYVKTIEDVISGSLIEDDRQVTYLQAEFGRRSLSYAWVAVVQLVPDEEHDEHVSESLADTDPLAVPAGGGVGAGRGPGADAHPRV